MLGIFHRVKLETQLHKSAVCKLFQYLRGVDLRLSCTAFQVQNRVVVFHLFKLILKSIRKNSGLASAISLSIISEQHCLAVSQLVRGCQGIVVKL